MKAAEQDSHVNQSDVILLRLFKVVNRNNAIIHLITSFKESKHIARTSLFLPEHKPK